MNRVGSTRITLNKYDKYKRLSRPYRIVFGMGMVTAGASTGIMWFYFGGIPLVLASLNICPLCVFTKKCTI